MAQELRNRRAPGPRIRFFRRIMLRSGTLLRPALVRDRSLRGMQLSADGLRPGDMVRVELSEGHEVLAQVRWAAGGRVGLSLCEPVQLPVPVHLDPIAPQEPPAAPGNAVRPLTIRKMR